MRRMKESQTLEVKTAKGGFPKSLWETYSSFCNTNGGRIILGASEDKSTHEIVIEGLEDPEKMLKQFWDTVNDSSKVSYCCLKDEDVRIMDSDGKRYIVIDVPRVSREFRPVYINGNSMSGTFKRNHEGDYHCTMHEIKSMMAESLDIPLDSRPVDMDYKTAFDQSTIDEYITSLKAYRPDHILLREGRDEFLIDIGAAVSVDGKIRPTMAGLLMFGKLSGILSQFTNYQLDYRDGSEERWSYRICSQSADWSGNLFDFIKHVNERLFKLLGTKFEMKGPYQTLPEAYVLAREAVCNAVVHADYYGRCGVSIVLRGQSLEITNPGDMRLPLNKAVRGGLSDPRNPFIMRMFQIIGYAERMGYGVKALSDANDEGTLYDFMMTEEVEPVLVRTNLGFTKYGASSPVSDKDMILTMMEDNPKVTIQILNEYTGISTAKLSLMINELRNEGKVVRINGTRGYWKVNRPS